MDLKTEDTILTHLKNWGQINLDKLSCLTNDQAVSLQTGLLSTLKDKDYFEWWATDNLIHDIHKFINDSGLVMQFEWTSWKGRRQVLADIRADKNISSIDLVKTLTSIIRDDRFAEGTFLRATTDGTIFKVFKKLKENLTASS